MTDLNRADQTADATGNTCPNCGYFVSRVTLSGNPYPYRMCTNIDCDYEELDQPPEGGGAMICGACFGKGYSPFDGSMICRVCDGLGELDSSSSPEPTTPASQVPDAAKLTPVEKNALVEQHLGPRDANKDRVVGGAETASLLEVFSDAATEKAVAHVRGTEVVELQGQLDAAIELLIAIGRGDDAGLEVAQLQEQLKAYIERLRYSQSQDSFDREHERLMEAVAERDAARECGCHAAVCPHFRHTAAERAEMESEEAAGKEGSDDAQH